MNPGNRYATPTWGKLRRGVAVLVPILLLIFVTACMPEMRWVEPEGASKPVGDAGIGDVLHGRNCSTCHRQVPGLGPIGGDLYSIKMRHSRAWLRAFVRSSDSLRAAGDSAAMAAYVRYPQYASHHFPFSNADVDTLFYYVDVMVNGGCVRYSF